MKILPVWIHRLNLGCSHSQLCYGLISEREIRDNLGAISAFHTVSKASSLADHFFFPAIRRTVWSYVPFVRSRCRDVPSILSSQSSSVDTLSSGTLMSFPFSWFTPWYDFWNRLFEQHKLKSGGMACLVCKAFKFIYVIVILCLTLWM